MKLSIVRVHHDKKGSSQGRVRMSPRPDQNGCTRVSLTSHLANSKHGAPPFSLPSQPAPSPTLSSSAHGKPASPRLGSGPLPCVGTANSGNTSLQPRPNQTSSLPPMPSAPSPLSQDQGDRLTSRYIAHTLPQTGFPSRPEGPHSGNSKHRPSKEPRHPPPTPREQRLDEDRRTPASLTAPLGFPPGGGKDRGKGGVVTKDFPEEGRWSGRNL